MHTSASGHSMYPDRPPIEYCWTSSYSIFFIHVPYKPVLVTVTNLCYYSIPNV